MVRLFVEKQTEMCRLRDSKTSDCQSKSELKAEDYRGRGNCGEGEEVKAKCRVCV